LPNLSPSALRRLARFHARLEGAQTVLQAADTTYRSLASNFEDALRSACEDAALELPPPGAPANIKVDWNTGGVVWEPTDERANGRVQEVPR
jgi:hypothetical protein